MLKGCCIMAKKNDFFEEEAVVDTAVDTVEEHEAVEAAEEAAAVEEAPVEAVQTVEPEAVEEAAKEPSDDCKMDYEDVEEIIAIEEAEKKRVVKRVISFVCIGVAVVGAVAMLYKLFFGNDD